MYVGDEWRGLSLKNKVSAIIYKEKFISKLGNQIINQVQNYLI